MKDELSYLLITPYTLKKSRTGGIISRLLSRSDLDLVAARMMAPTEEFSRRYAELIRQSLRDIDPISGELISDYIHLNFPPHEGRYQRVMTLLFRGEDACEKIYAMAGRLKEGTLTGETIRDTYSDYVLDRDGKLRYFEPAVLTAPTMKSSLSKLKLLADFFDSEENVVGKPLLDADDAEERSLVIIKPDNWRYPSTRPGNIIDMLSRTGLRIVGCKIYQMSVAEALEFYGPVRGALRKKLAPIIGKKAREILGKEFQLELPESDDQVLSDAVGVKYADDQFARIIEFMAGSRPEECPREKLDDPGKVKCMVLVYQGLNAVDKIREVLGPTDPTKAPGGTIRREFGTDVMVNTAHASDSAKNAIREMGVVKMDKNKFSKIANEYLRSVQ